MKVLVVQFLRGMFDRSADSVFKSTNPRSIALRELLSSDGASDFELVSINTTMKAARVTLGARSVLFFDVPPTRVLWVLYVFLLNIILRPGLVVCFGIENSVVSALASIASRSVVVSVIGSDLEYLHDQYRLPALARGAVGFLVGFTLFRAKHIFVPNANVKEAVVGRIGSARRVREFTYRVPKIFAAPSSRTRFLSSEPPIVMTVARLSPVKGLDTLVRAARLVIERIPSAIFVIQSAYDEPSYRRHLEDLMVKEGVRSHFKINSRGIPNDKMPGLYASADLYVLPSLSEGRNSSLLEALACGLPAVATRVGANAEAVADGENGFLVNPGDSAAMAERIVRILRDPALLRRLGGKDISRHHTTKDHDLGESLVQTVLRLTGN